MSNTGLCWGTWPDPEDTMISNFGYTVKRGEKLDTVEKRAGRLNYLNTQLEEKLETIKPDLVMVEQYAYSQQKVVYQAEFGGMLRCRLIDYTPDVIEVAPSQLKKFVLGKSTGDKNQILLQVYKRWSVTCQNDDEADAYVLYRIGLCYAGICEPETNAQREVIEKLKGE